MTVLPPFDDRWVTGGRWHVTATGGTIDLGGVVVYVRAAHKAADGAVVFEYQHASDAEFEAMTAE